MKTTIKEIFENNNLIITNVIQGYNGQVRIDAKTRFHKADQENLFSEWCTIAYANKLANENYGKNINDFSCYSY